MITPIYPAAVRYLTVLTGTGNDIASFTGITLQSVNTSAFTSTLSLYVGARFHVALVTVPLRVDSVSMKATLTDNVTVTNFSNVTANASIIGAPLFVTLPDLRTSVVLGSSEDVYVYCCIAAPTTTTTTMIPTLPTSAMNVTLNTTGGNNKTGNSSNVTTLAIITTMAPGSAAGPSLVASVAAILVVLAAW